MNIPDPRHAAATAPAASPQAPNGGPSAFGHRSGFDRASGQCVLQCLAGTNSRPQALGNFAAMQERPPALPTSAPGAIGAAAAVPGTSIPGAVQAVPFSTRIPIVPFDTARAVPAGALASGLTGLPAGAAAAPPAPPPSLLGDADLAALPQTLGPVTNLVPGGLPGGFSHGLPASVLPAESLYFLEGAGKGAASSLPVDVPTSLPASLPATLPAQPSALAAAPRVSIPGAPGPQFEQSPTYGRNFPSEDELRRKT